MAPYPIALWQHSSSVLSRLPGLRNYYDKDESKYSMIRVCSSICMHKKKPRGSWRCRSLVVVSLCLNGKVLRFNFRTFVARGTYTFLLDISNLSAFETEPQFHSEPQILAHSKLTWPQLHHHQQSRSKRPFCAKHSSQ